jgi:hypothetical protein
LTYFDEAKLSTIVEKISEPIQKSAMSTYDYLVKKGRKKGKMEGIQEGLAKGKLEIAAQLLRNTRNGRTWQLLK